MEGDVKSLLMQTGSIMLNGDATIFYTKCITSHIQLKCQMSLRSFIFVLLLICRLAMQEMLHFKQFDLI